MPGIFITNIKKTQLFLWLSATTPHYKTMSSEAVVTMKQCRLHTPYSGQQYKAVILTQCPTFYTCIQLTINAQHYIQTCYLLAVAVLKYAQDFTKA